MEIDEIQRLVSADAYDYSQYADLERAADDLTFDQIEQALLSGTILEQYEDTGRGESCLVVGFAGALPIHVVCGWRRGRMVIITAYVPSPPRFIDPWTRGERTS